MVSFKEDDREKFWIPERSTTTVNRSEYDDYRVISRARPHIDARDKEVGPKRESLPGFRISPEKPPLHLHI